MAALRDLWSRRFWRLAGRPVDIDGDESWLDAPVSTRTDHELCLGGMSAVRLHYRLERAS